MAVSPKTRRNERINVHVHPRDMAFKTILSFVYCRTPVAVVSLPREGLRERRDADRTQSGVKSTDPAPRF